MFWQQVVNGLVSGSAYALVALGYALIYGVLGLINLAQGELFMAGAFGLWIGATLLHLSWPGAVLLGMLLAGLISLSMEKFVFRPLSEKNPLIPMLAAIGLSIFLQTSALLFFGPETKPFPFLLPQKIFQLGFIKLSALQGIVICSALLMVFFLWWYLNFSKWGKGLQAVSMDKEAALIIGITPNFCVSQAFLLSGLLSGLGGILMAAYYNATYPYMGILPGLKGFCAAVLGGTGSVFGAVVGGLILGIAENLGAAYISSGFKDGFAFTILILILLIRPKGILGK
ncbi:MAG: Inner-membrane translocator [Desulfonauticus sp. 38_4375]|nr:MAG: Inner-membrane translocator [Desulfonauticus sp. 38_4375]